MSQAAAYPLPVVGPQAPDVYSGKINDILAALLTLNRGAARPSYAAASTLWVKTVSGTAEQVYLYDGAGDILLFTYNPTSGAITAGDFTVGAANVGSDLISGITATTAADGDMVLFGDVSNANVPRRTTVGALWTLLFNTARTFVAKLKVTIGVMVDQTLVDGATINWDCASGQVASVTLGGNRTLATPTNIPGGAAEAAFCSVTVIQDATGSRTLTWPSCFKFKASTAPALTTTAAKRDAFQFKADGTNFYETGRTLNV